VRRLALAAMAAVSAFIPTACGNEEHQAPQSDRTQPVRESMPASYLGKRTTAPVILAAGDIASCESEDDAATARLIARTPGTVLALGDEAYDNGAPAEFSDCYAPSWGRFKRRTQPAPGNHEYDTDGAAGYFDYFGAAAGSRDKGYYSFDLGGWHIVSLNSNCSDIGGCDAGSPQERWLRADLAAHPGRCTLGYWHHPYFTSGTEHGREEEMGPIWQALYEQGAEVVLSAHEHNYERFAPQTPAGKRDPRRGIVDFVVGTGGKSHYDLGRPIDNSEARNDKTFGVLELRLRRSGYSWRFLAAGGPHFSDSGSASCHS
jgi:calcineurin-like phosphoesterase family protein